MCVKCCTTSTVCVCVLMMKICPPDEAQTCSPTTSRALTGNTPNFSTRAPDSTQEPSVRARKDMKTIWISDITVYKCKEKIRACEHWMWEILCEKEIRLKVTVMFDTQRVGQILHPVFLTHTVCVGFLQKYNDLTALSRMEACWVFV